MAILANGQNLLGFFFRDFYKDDILLILRKFDFKL